jgi:F0F1-type ATP synthase membrane subunit c/vacuolar-type H+-ATPase subunit K
MQNTTTPQAPQNQNIMTMKLLWGAMTFSTVMYFYVLSMRPAPETPLPEGFPPAVLPFAVLAVLLFLASMLLPAILLKAAAAKVKSPSPSTPEVLTASFTPFIVRVALAEAICVLGLVVAMEHGLPTFYPFWAASLLALGAAFPTESKVLSSFEKARIQAGN